MKINLCLVEKEINNFICDYEHSKKNIKLLLQFNNIEINYNNVDITMDKQPVKKFKPVVKIKMRKPSKKNLF